jgi:hypothetical protein
MQENQEKGKSGIGISTVSQLCQSGIVVQAAGQSGTSGQGL